VVSEHLRTRLECREAVLRLLDRRRSETGDPNIGSAVEKRILDLELSDLERASMDVSKAPADAGSRGATFVAKRKRRNLADDSKSE